MDELFNDRFPNEYLGDTNLRLAVDVSADGRDPFRRDDQGICCKIWQMPPDLPQFRLELPDGFGICWQSMTKAETYELAPDPMNEETSGTA